MKRMLLAFMSIMIALSTLLHAEVPTQESVTKLYVATFNRAPDAAGLDYWVNDSGLQLEQISQSFFDQSETQTTYPAGYTNTDFVTAVYANLFNRAPEPAGLDYWVGELNAGRIEKSVFILAVINGAQDTVLGNDATILDNKTIVGLAYADAGLDDVVEATEIMSGITDDYATVTAALERILENTDVSTSGFLLSFCDTTHGIELWTSGGTEVSTKLVLDINDGQPSSEIDEITLVNGTVFFSAIDSIYGKEVWKSDGTTAGTMIVKDINPGSSAPKFFASHKEKLFFAAEDADHGAEIWISDGTDDGTFMIKDIKDGPTGSKPSMLISSGDIVFFQANPGSGNELWKTDGTESSTVKVASVLVPQQFTDVDGVLFFRANGGGGDELFKSDGTTEGTVMVKDIDSGPSNPNNLTNVNGTLFFSADSQEYGAAELWKSNGTELGTVLVKNIHDKGGAGVEGAVNVSGMLYFTAVDLTKSVTHGRELWKSDGTDAGTVMVKDINPGASNSTATQLTNVNGTLFFTANNGVNGIELWKSNGTPDGTVIVKDIVSGGLDSDPINLRVNEDKLYFETNATATRDLWVSDGTPDGTIRIQRGCTP